MKRKRERVKKKKKRKKKENLNKMGKKIEFWNAKSIVKWYSIIDKVVF